jgi:predicted nucleotidyltransferase
MNYNKIRKFILLKTGFIYKFLFSSIIENISIEYFLLLTPLNINYQLDSLFYQQIGVKDLNHFYFLLLKNMTDIIIKKTYNLYNEYIYLVRKINN